MNNRVAIAIGAVTIAIFKLIPVTLTLAGIAGFILSIGMAVDANVLIFARIKEEGLPMEAYDWYLDLRRYGTFTHAGFGLGLERTVGWICGTPHIREVIAFPRMMHRLKP